MVITVEEDEIPGGRGGFEGAVRIAAGRAGASRLNLGANCRETGRFDLAMGREGFVRLNSRAGLGGAVNSGTKVVGLGITSLISRGGDGEARRLGMGRA